MLPGAQVHNYNCQIAQGVLLEKESGEHKTWWEKVYLEGILASKFGFNKNFSDIIFW